MQRDLVKMLEYEAKRKPLVGEMWERRAELTDEEIDAASLPLPWFRKAFRMARDQAGQVSLVDLARANPIDPKDVVPGINNTMGQTAEYTGQTAYFQSAGKFLLEVKSSSWLFFPDTGGAWHYETFFADIPLAFGQKRNLQRQTRQEYVIAWADELRRRYGYASG